MFEELLKQWANEQGFQTWSQDHAAVLRNLVSWLNGHAVEHHMHTDAAYVACPHRARVNHPAIGEIVECEFAAPVM